MRHPIYALELAAPRAAPDRRNVLGGLALTAVGVAGGVAAFGPNLADLMAAPASPSPSIPQAQPDPLPAIPAAVPRPVDHGPEARRAWLAFRQLYVTPEGRVVDTGNGNVSHSEGQGWGLLAAQACDDQASFETILAWTVSHLARRRDSLHAWRFRPNDVDPVGDLNNATDGDLYIAAALSRAAVRWQQPAYAARAARIGRDILSLVRQAGHRTVLLPGAAGFESPEAFTLNPSYNTLALLPDVAALVPSPHWAALRRDAVGLALDGRFGRWSLPPDWLRASRVDGALSIAPGWPPRFSFDAIRVPLHLAWAGLPATALLDSFRLYWTGNHNQPAWADLRSDTIAPYRAPAGICAVAAVVMGLPGAATIAMPAVVQATDYYSAGLVLLSRLAEGECRAAA